MRKTIFCTAVSFYMMSCMALASGQTDNQDKITISVSPGGVSIEQAIEKAASRKDVPVEIEIAPGTYTIRKSLSFTSADNRPEDAPLTLRGAGMGRTVITGSIQIPPFSDNGDGVWTADLSELLPLGGDIPQLWVNGQRACLASSPDGMDFYRTQDVLEVFIDSLPNPRNGIRNSAGHMVKAPEEAATALKAIGSDYPRKMKAEIYHKWDVTRWPVNQILPERNSFIVFGKAMPNWNSLGPEESNFKLIDDLSLLNAPGEYYFDDIAQILHYVPRPGEKPESTVATVPVTGQVLTIDGASGIRFEGITFNCTSHRTGWRGDDAEQAGASTDAAVMLDRCHGIEFSDCEITGTGNCGIWFHHSAIGCRMDRCYIHDIGISGVKIGNPRLYGDEDTAITSDITVDNCIIRAGSRNLATGVGVHILHAKDCHVTHNDISDFYYSGVSLGWVWGYSHSYAAGNKINFNHIHHLGWGLLSDMGGIYTLGTGAGEEACNNVIHDVWSFGYGGWGLYTDEGSSGVLMENNLVYHLKSSGFHQHYGKENVIRNNIFIDQAKDQIAATRVEDHLSFTFSNNIICFHEGKLYDINWKDANTKVEKNLYWHYGDDVRFGDLSLKEWQAATGKDAGSIIADPRIGKDWIPTNRKALKKIGFKPFDPSQAGVYGDREWVEKAAFDPARIAEYEQRINKLKGTK